MRLSSPSFDQYQSIPKKHALKGDDLSPELRFHDVPQKVTSFALICDDPDAPMGTFTHWVAWNIPGEVRVLPEGGRVTCEGINDYGTVRYGGPCPPKGPAHRYFFRLFALDSVLKLPQGASKEELLREVKGHILAQAELVGTFES